MTVAKAAKESRRYRSPLREVQAQHTRTAVLDAAGSLFVAPGYAGTTMKDIAARAQVSVETVYGQGTKSSLLLAAVDRALAGDDDPVPLVERPAMRAVLDAPDAGTALDRFRDLIAAGLPTALPVLHAFGRAAGADPEIAAAYELYDERRRADMTRVAQALRPGLRPGVSVDTAADVIGTLLDPAAVHSLVERRGWGAERWSEWVVDALRRLLLQ